MVLMLIIQQEFVLLFARRYRISTQILYYTYVLTHAQEGILEVKSIKLAFQFVIWVIMEIQLLLYVLLFAQQKYILMVRILQEHVLDHVLITLDMQITIVDSAAPTVSILCLFKLILITLIKLAYKFVRMELGLLTILLLIILSINVSQDVLQDLLIIFQAGVSVFALLILKVMVIWKLGFVFILV